MTIVTVGTEAIIEQINKQLNKLIDVVKVVDLTEGEHIERELVMLKIEATDAECKQFQQTLTEHGADIVDESSNGCVAELLGNSEKIDAFITALDPFTITEVVRSGVSGIYRGDKRLAI
jgi:acetolactate synthase-1/3 small subunit